MKTTKFRVFDDGIMFYEKHFANVENYSNSFRLSVFFKKFRDDAIIMQYIGVDALGFVPIYEGDVIEDNVGRTFKVVFEKGCFMFEYLKNPKQKQIYTSFIKTQLPLKVKGNIYENGELIETFS